MKHTILLGALVAYLLKCNCLTSDNFNEQYRTNPTQTVPIHNNIQKDGSARVIRLYDFINGIMNRNVSYCSEKNDTTQTNKHKVDKTERVFEIFDPEWTAIPRNNNLIMPNIIMNLYESMKNDCDNISKNVDIIRCLYSTRFSITTKEVLIKFKYNRPKRQEQIIKSDLYIHRTNLRIDEKPAGFSIIRLYQIISNENYTRNADMNKLLSVVYVSPHTKGWQIFNVLETIEDNGDNEINLGFLLTVSDSLDNMINPRYFGFDELERVNPPFLVIYFQQQISSGYDSERVPFADSSNESTEFSKTTIVSSSSLIDNGGGNRCKREPYRVNLRKDGFENFLIHPGEIMLHRCNGVCDNVPENNLKNHARFMKLFQKEENFQAFCVPESYSHAILMFYDNIGNIVIKKYYEMIVKKCNCK